MAAQNTDQLMVSRGGTIYRVTAAELLALLSGASAWTTVKKVADESRAANVALTVDSTLRAALTIGTWVVRGVAAFSTANATMDFKYDLNLIGTGTWSRRFHRHVAAGAVAGTDNETDTIGTGVVPSTAVAATTTGIGRVEFEAVIVVTVAGEVQFRWAQNTSDAGNLTCLRGSWLEYMST